MRHAVAHRTRHSKPWHLLIFKPHSEWANRFIAILDVPKGVNATALIEHSFRLRFKLWLVIDTHSFTLENQVAFCLLGLVALILILLISVRGLRNNTLLGINCGFDGARVARIGADKASAFEED